MEEKKLKITAIQMSSVIADKKANLSKVEKLIEANYAEGTDVIVLPEVWTVGWHCPSFRENAESVDHGKTLEFLKTTAQKYNVHVIGGSYVTTDEDGNFRNSCVVINPNGSVKAVYNKMHLFSYYGCDESSYVKAGETPIIVEINGVNIGLSICYDIRFPEIYRAYRKAGADVLINMAAWPLNREIHWECLTRARAVENQCYFVALTQSGALKDDGYNLGKSRIIDYEGSTLAEILDGEGAIHAELEFAKLYDFRQKCTVLNDIQDEYNVRIK